MPDREKVQEWARDFIAYADELDIARDAYRGIMEYIDDALTLLREQETTWVREEDRVNHWHCEKCGFVEGMVAHIHNYCPRCGRKVKR